MPEGQGRSSPRFSLAALDTKLLLDIFHTAKKVVKFKLRFFTQIRDILTHVSEILPCFGLKGLRTPLSLPCDQAGY